jgi:hypothetical protein
MYTISDPKMRVASAKKTRKILIDIEYLRLATLFLRELVSVDTVIGYLADFLYLSSSSITWRIEFQGWTSGRSSNYFYEV